MLPSVNWLHVTVAAAAGFAISMIFYALPIMRTHRQAQAATNVPRRGSDPGTETLLSAILARLVNTFIYSFMLAWFLQLTGITTLGMGLLLLLVILGRVSLAPRGWDRDMINPPHTVKLMDNARFILMYVVMTGILMFWR
jgi:hypothetical protein